MPLDVLVTGRIATLADEQGFGWVEAIGIRDGVVAFAGSEVYLETRADPFTRRVNLEPNEVAIPGLTDAHLHFVEAAMARRQVDLASSPTVDDGLARIGAARDVVADPEGWILGQGWDSDRWGAWPTAVQLERVVPGRRVALWAHDHHALWVSRAGLRSAGIDPDELAPEDPPGGVIQRDMEGHPTGILLESATRLVTAGIPAPSSADVDAALLALEGELISVGLVACHDPGGVVPDPGLTYSYPAYRRLAEAGRLRIRVHASMRDDAVPEAIDQGLRSGMTLGGGPAGRVRVGWQKCFADGSLGSRTAALLDHIEPEPDRPLAPDRRRGVWNTDPDVLADLVARAAAAGIATQVHAIGDAAVRAALDALEPSARDVPLMPRLEHVQLLDPTDRSRFVGSGIAASVQPSHLGSDAALARRSWGSRAEANGYTWRSIADTGAVLAFGTDAPVESFDPWPGITLAVTREDPAWPAGTPPFGPTEALTLERALRAACIDPAIAARETDRGRLTVGQRADVVVLPAAALEEPVTPGGPLSTARPSLVLIDGAVVFEA